MTKLKLLASTLAASALLLSGAVACSADKPNASPKASAGSDHDQALKFAQCMRAKGVDMPDPGADGGIGTGIAPGAGTGTGAPAPDGSTPVEAISLGADSAAMDACRKFLPNGGEVKGITPAQRQEELKFAKCMRAHGIDMPDPNADGAIQGAPVDINDAAAQKRNDEANRACNVLASPTPAK